MPKNKKTSRAGMMKKVTAFLSKFSLHNTSFRQQIAFSFTLGIVTLTLLSSLATSSLTSRTLYMRLLDEGERITRELAIQSTLAILYESSDTAAEASQAALAFPDVVGVAIYTKNHELLYSSGKVNEGGPLKRLPEDLNVELENDNGWHFVMPVYSRQEDLSQEISPFEYDETPQAELVGYVRLKKSKAALYETSDSILKSNLTVSAGLATVLLLILLFITRRLTKPLGDLIKVMSLPEEGEYYVRANVNGPKDVDDMQYAFNTMIDVLEGREELLKHVRDKALEAARVKGEFAANVTHELRTPMNGVLGMLELLHGTGLSSQQNEYVDIAKGSADALLLLIDDILDFAKVEAGKSNFDVVDFHLHDMVKDVTELLKIQAHRKDIDLLCEVDEDVPKSIKAVSSRIRQILINLIGNAIKFTEQGNVTLKISLKSAEDEGQKRKPGNFSLKFSIIDTGIGIPEESQSKIFEAFSQVDGSSTRKYGGSGLGLAICSTLVNQMGGEIGISSELNKGSCFWFSIPVEESLEEVGEMSEHISLSGESPIETAAMNEKVIKPNSRILVVEDNRTNQYVAIGMLERFDCHVTVVSDGAQAVERVMRESFDLILMDVQMPVMDGFTATRTIREKEEESNIASNTIIAMTANVSEDDVTHCIEAGMNDFLGKPLNIEALEATLLKNLGIEDTQIKKDISQDVGSPIDGDTVIPNEVVDEMILSELRSNVGHALADMIEAFIEDLEPHLKSIKEGLHDDDARKVEMSAHALKGSSSTFGANTFADFCKIIEGHAKKNNLPEAKLLLNDFMQSADDVQAYLTNERMPSVNTREQVEAFNANCVLIVDDQRDMRMAIAGALEQDGYHLIEAASGEQAISICEKETPDLILMDGLMPGIDGFKTCKELRKTTKYSHTPILIVTSLEEANSIDAAFAAGANDYIPKPVNFSVLRKRISRLIEASETEKHVRQLAYHDPLTGLANRTTFLKKLDRLVENPKRDGKLFAVLFIDLDRFKMINDTLGHDIGDMLLKAVSDRLLGSVRTSDLVARLGGDEFTIILESIASAENAATIADKICRRMSEAFVFMGQRMHVTTSIGISLYPIDGRNTVELLKHADTAMFRAKEQRDGYMFYEMGMDTLIVKRVQMETELRKAIENDELVVYYQPQKSLITGDICGMEALVRWQHPEKGMIPPFEFIPLAEETGLIISLGDWVLKHACLQLREWLDKGYQPLRLSVNLSGRQIEDDKLVETVEKILRDTNIPGQYLELEITESAMMKDPDNVISVLNKLRDMSISLAIDDFGTGHSSLSYLRSFPVDTLKIDRSFVMDITTSKEDASIITGIIALAKSLNLLTIAEGVETYEQQVMLLEQDCDVIQGYYLNKPLPSDVFEKEIYLQDHPLVSDLNKKLQMPSGVDKSKNPQKHKH